MTLKAAVLTGMMMSAAVTPAHAEMRTLGPIPGTWYDLGRDDEGRMCAARTIFPSTGINMQMDMTTIGWMFTLSHEAWRLQVGATYDGRVSIDGQPWRGEVTAIDEHTITLPINDAFLHAFTAGHAITIRDAAGMPLTPPLSLAGTSRMITAVARCTEQAQSHQPFGQPKSQVMPQAPFAPRTAPVARGREYGA